MAIPLCITQQNLRFVELQDDLLPLHFVVKVKCTLLQKQKTTRF